MAQVEKRSSQVDVAEVAWPLLMVRAAAGGVLMGLANLVPGISGGTMLLATGVYPHFIGAIADVTRFRWRGRSLAVLAVVGAAAVLALFTLARVLGQLVTEQTWVMYSLFIGLTLGGAPIIWRMVDRRGGTFTAGVCGGLVVMVGLAAVQLTGLGTEQMRGEGFVLMFAAGVAGASAMILPGVSGAYLLLVLGVYLTILDGLDRLREAAGARSLELAMEPTLGIVLPVALGILVGVVLISNVLKWVLDRYHRATLGVLLGLLLGAVAGLWPFQQGVEPTPGAVIDGRRLVLVEGQLLYETTGEPMRIRQQAVVLVDDVPTLAETGRTLRPKDYPREFYVPGFVRGASALLLSVVGFGVTLGIGRLGGQRGSSVEGAR